jgi:hypothetical protein
VEIEYSIAEVVSSFDDRAPGRLVALAGRWEATRALEERYRYLGRIIKGARWIGDTVSKPTESELNILDLLSVGAKGETKRMFNLRHGVIRG